MNIKSYLIKEIRVMKKIIVVLLVMSVFCSPVISSVYAGQIQAQEMSQTESRNMETMEANSAVLVNSIECGAGEGLGYLVGLFLLGVLMMASVT